jgi:hypothetical protein
MVGYRRKHSIATANAWFARKSTLVPRVRLDGLCTRQGGRFAPFADAARSADEDVLALSLDWARAYVIRVQC